MRVRETVRQAAGTSGHLHLQLLGFAVNVGVQQAGGQWADEKTLACFLELTLCTGLVCLNRLASWGFRAEQSTTPDVLPIVSVRISDPQQIDALIDCVRVKGVVEFSISWPTCSEMSDVACTIWNTTTVIFGFGNEVCRNVDYVG